MVVTQHETQLNIHSATMAQGNYAVSIELPDEQVFKNLKNATHFAIDIGEFRSEKVKTYLYKGNWPDFDRSW